MLSVFDFVAHVASIVISHLILCIPIVKSVLKSWGVALLHNVSVALHAARSRTLRIRGAELISYININGSWS